MTFRGTALSYSFTGTGNLEQSVGDLTLNSYPNANGKGREGNRREGKGDEVLSYRHIGVFQFLATMCELLQLWPSSPTWQKPVGCSIIIHSWSKLH